MCVCLPTVCLATKMASVTFLRKGGRNTHYAQEVGHRSHSGDTAMGKLICSRCKQVFEQPSDGRCPQCYAEGHEIYDFKNSDEVLKREIPRVLEQRRKAGLEGLVEGLEAVIINTEPDRQRAAVEELLHTTGFQCVDAFEDAHYRSCVLQAGGSADFVIRSRKEESNPFAPFNRFPRSEHLPDTRLETLVFATPDIERYVTIQKEQGVQFLTEEILHADSFSTIQTAPSRYTGNSIGFAEWHGPRRCYRTHDSRPLDWRFEKKTSKESLDNISALDHAATRVRAEDRDAAILEFMELTNYHFDFAIYVKLFNSITNVARLSAQDFAMVFTSGISSYVSDETSGPTEKFIHNYGTRVHHMAFRTENIEDTISSLRDDGQAFLIDLVGSPQEGLKQTFTTASQHTLLVNEYIYRYGDFDGFFTRSNVTLLTGATGKQ